MRIALLVLVSLYAVGAVVFGTKYWPATDIASPFELPRWKRLIDCIFIGVTWLPQAIRILWKEM
jgi:hypothetical protein